MNKRERMIALVTQLIDEMFTNDEGVKAPAEDKKEEKADNLPKEEKKSSGPAFSKANPANSPTQLKQFHEQWGKLTKAQQEDYIDHKIDSLGNPLEVKEEKAKKSKPAKTETPAPDTSEAVPPSVTIEDVKNALRELMKTKGNDEAAALIKSLGATKVSELKPEQYPEFISKSKGENGSSPSLFD